MNDRVTLGNILFATDLSGQSARAVGWLRWLCGRYYSTAYVLNVLDVPSIGLTAEDIAKRQIEAEERFSSFIRKHNLKQKPFTSVLATGDTAQVITEFVGSCKIALVLLGSRAVGLHRLLRGSISEKVVRSTDCPITPDFDIRDFDISPDGHEVVLERVQDLPDIALLDLPRP